MDMPDGSQRLIRGWEGSGMEENGWEAGLHRQDTHPIQLLQQKEKRLQRIAHVLAVVSVILLSLVVTLLVTAVHGGRGHQSADNQAMVQHVSHSSDFSAKQQNPSVMLTAPTGPITESHLQWESNVGHAFLRGGFYYNSSSKHLVVPTEGIYRVFLQITYESKKCDSDEPSVMNRVFLFQDTYPTDVLILSSVDSVNCSIKQSKSLYTAGLFHLEAKSRLHVKSSHPDLIALAEHQTFFGAELLHQ